MNAEREAGVAVQSVMKPSLIDRLKRAAELEGRTLSGLIAYRMEQWIDSRKEKRS